MKTAEIDKAKAEAFVEQMGDVLNKGGLSLMVSIGHRTGSLMAWPRCRPPPVSRSPTPT